MVKILITGGMGYIGTHTIAQLVSNGFEVVSIDNFSNSNEFIASQLHKVLNQRIKNYKVDLKNINDLKKVFEQNTFNAVIHLAAYKSVRTSINKPLDYYENNIVGLIKVLKCMQQYNVKNIVFSSSCVVYGNPQTIIDRSTISLFKEILKCLGRKSTCSKSKGGIKMHRSINADEIIPNLVWFSPSTTHDHQFLNKLTCDSNTIYIFDKAYNDYNAFEHFSNHETGFITRVKENAIYTIIASKEIPESIHSGILEDVVIEIEVKKEKTITKLKLRKVKFYDREHKREFEFLTNLMEIRADMIAALYKTRWQIELIPKQLKQNFPLKYFLGDKENAIKIQIYCVLIVNLLIAVIKKRLRRRWAFSNLVSF